MSVSLPKTYCWRVLVALLCTAAVVACNRGATRNAGGASAAQERYAMVVFLAGSEFFNWAYAGMRDAGAALGPNVRVELQGPAEWDASLEARTVNQLAARKIDGLLVTAAEPSALVPAIDNAVRARVPVLTFDSDAPASARLAFVGTNNYNAGWVAGRAMAEWLGGSGDVGVSTFPGPDHLRKRVDGFTDALHKFGPNVRIVATVNDEGDVARAEAHITAMLQAHSAITGIFCAHGNPGPGAAAAVRNLGLTGKVQILAFDFATPVLELIDGGEIKGTVGQDPYLMGYVGMMLLFAAHHPTAVPSRHPGFGPVPDGGVDTGVRILYRKDIEQYKHVPDVR